MSAVIVEEKWLEREAQFAQHVQYLQSLVAAQGDSGVAAAEAAPSAASDVLSGDDLELDDEKWGKAVCTKRKALLRRERDVLAGKVRSTLGKVAVAASPFGKKA